MLDGEATWVIQLLLKIYKYGADFRRQLSNALFVQTSLIYLYLDNQNQAKYG